MRKESYTDGTLIIIILGQSLVQLFDFARHNLSNLGGIFVPVQLIP